MRAAYKHKGNLIEQNREKRRLVQLTLTGRQIADVVSVRALENIKVNCQLD